METDLGRELLAEMYRRMQRIRRFEDQVVILHEKGEIPGALHTSHGQEGEIVGACMALRDDDYMVGNHRSHGHPIGKGAKLDALMAELFGKQTGICKGKGGSMHLADFSVGSLGETSIVGSGFPVATGAALGVNMQGSDRVSLCFFGDGASSEGTFHESLNLAAIWKLPVIFLCENNGYAVTTPARETVAVADIASRAAGYGMPGVVVDGQDVIRTYEAVQGAVRRARNGEGPSLIEAKTYRFKEHAAGLGRTFNYRTSSELEMWMSQRDPIPLFRRQLVETRGFTTGEVERIDREVETEIEASIAFARQSPLPDPREAFTHVFGRTA